MTISSPFGLDISHQSGALALCGGSRVDQIRQVLRGIGPPQLPNVGLDPLRQPLDRALRVEADGAVIEQGEPLDLLCLPVELVSLAGDQGVLAGDSAVRIALR